MSDGAVAAALVTAVGCGLVGGVFFAFSGFVMPALARLAPAQESPRCSRSTARRCGRRS